MTVMSANCAFMANAETFTAADFTGDDKFCTQLFYGTEMVGERIQEGAWGRFEAVDGDASKIRLTNFKNEGSVTFTINGDQLILDGIKSKDGVECGNTTLKTVSHNVKNMYQHGIIWNPKRDFHYFQDNRSEYIGNISKDENGHITVVFDNQYLSFTTRPNNSAVPNNYANIANDAFNTFKKCVFQILKNSNELNETPIVYKGNDGLNSEIWIVRNFSGAGEVFIYPSANETSTSDGIVLSLNKTGKTFSIDKQAYKGIMEPELMNSYLISPAWVGACVENMKVGNYWVAGVDDGDVNGNYSVVSRNINPGWHKNHGGAFEVQENICCHGDAGVTYYLNPDNNKVDQQPMQDIYLTIENTPEAVLEVTACEFNDNGIHVSGKITEDNLSDAVESYNVYLISGKHYDISESDEFDGNHPDGHSKAVLVAENLVPENGTVSFDELFSFYAPIDKGWNPYDNGGTMSVYLRYNLKSDTETATDAPLRAPANVYAFGSMVPRDYNIATGITAVKPAVVSISSKSGALTITGAESATVYDMAGRTVYSGPTGTISLNPGLYIVTAGEMTVKAIVR